jgi:hypothetical protein
MADKEIIGEDDCHDCGQPVAVKLNKNRKGYYFCECGAHARYNSATSRRLIAEHAKGKNHGTTGEKKAGTGTDGTGSANGTGTGDGSGTGNGTGFGFFRG